MQHLALNEQLSKEVQVAVCNAMHNTFAVNVIPGDFEVGEGMVSLVGDVSGVIGLVQEQLEGTMTFCMTFEMVKSLLPEILGHSVVVTHEMTVDAVGEITNMIFGQVKTELNRRGYGLKLGIPSVVTGRGHFVSQFHRGKFMVVPFYLEGHLFQVHIAVYEAKEKQGAA